MNAKHYIRLFFIILTLNSTIQAQPQFFEYLNGGYAEGDTRIIPKQNGGWYVAHVSSLPIGSIVNILILSSFDECGEHEFDTVFRFSEIRAFSIADVESLDDGTFWIGFLGTNDFGIRNGLIVKFNEAAQIIHSKAISSPGDYYLYGLDVNTDGELALFANTNSPDNYSVVVEMDLNGNFLESKRLLFTVTWGNFAATADGGYVCRSGPIYYKIDAAKNVEWAHLIPTYYATNEPLEYQTGYVFSVYPYASNTDQNFLLKFDPDGNIEWQTENFGNIGRTRIRVLSNGNLMQIGSGFPDDVPEQHVVFTEIAPDGQLVRQKAFNPDLSSTLVGQDFNELPNGAIVFCGKANNGSVLHSMTTPNFGLFCGDYNYASNAPSNQIQLLPANYNVADQDIMIRDVSWDFVDYISVGVDRFCFENILQEPEVPNDTVLCAGDSLLVDLRATNYEIEWFDGTTVPVKYLRAPGSYVVTFVSCNDFITATIVLDTMDCSCNFYLPNVITPNGDQTNDEFRLYTNCAVTNYQMSVFDRWGNQVFRSNQPDQAWPTQSDQLDIALGVYVAQISFEAFENGELKQHIFMQDITVLR